MTPSILYLLGINVENVFEGHSLFDEQGREAFPFILGSHRENYFIKTIEDQKFFSIHDIREANCDQQKDYSGKGLSVCEYKTWWNYKKYLIMNDRFWDK